MLLLALLITLNAQVLAADLGPIPTEGPPPSNELAHLRARLTSLLNQHRAAAGVRQLTPDELAQSAAQSQAEEMLKTGKIQHVDSQGRSPMERFNALGGKAAFYAENVGWYSPGVLDEQLLWDVLAGLDAQMMREMPPEDGHRRNILSPHPTGVGIGIAVGAKGVFMAEDFVGYAAK